ncbi:RNA 3'-terminal phosphate cyclase-like protein [Chionoecetes opilio]|uniref:RNA 3'-terminal phosphate cyclase-like protein n=1 Tax=Chionoecetes opilio TaxID=41210 RepID=A0A8J4XN36_CHIOP|nr:RNA 3'-terminal phosphate cyclase-like protein [Chionoecetes opilio]
MEVGGVLTYEGNNYFRQRLILSTLSGKPVRIRNIRTKADDPGLKDYEVSFIRLLDCLNNGSIIEVNETGTALLYKPGVLVGGQLEHSCPLSRGIGKGKGDSQDCNNYRGITLLSVPGKVLAHLLLTRIRSHLLKHQRPQQSGFTPEHASFYSQLDPSVDMICASLVPVLRRFVGGEDGPSVKCMRRGLRPGGNGKVMFTCPVRRSLTAFQWLDSGQIKRIRGVTYTSRVTPTVANRMLDAAKGVFLKYLTDVYFTVDNAKAVSPGFGLCAVAESNKGTVICAEAMCCTPGQEERVEGAAVSTPEEIGQEAASRLLEEIWRGGCVDAIAQTLLLLFMALTPTDVSKALLGPLTPYTMHFLRHLKDFFHVTFKIDEHKEERIAEDGGDLPQRRTGAAKLLLTCVGVGYTNIGKGQT